MDGSYIAADGDKLYFFATLEKYARDASEMVKKTVESERAKGLNVTKIEDVVSQAEQALSTGNFAKARELADQAKAQAESIASDAPDAKKSINGAASIISQEKSKDINVAKADVLLAKSEQAFNQGDYEKAKSFAENAAALSLDIDQDGITNDEDFAPTIKNLYIYAAVPIVIVLLVGTVKAGMVMQEQAKVRLEKRKRLEAEKRRSEAEEKRQREKAKQDILDKIDEVTRRER